VTERQLRIGLAAAIVFGSVGLVVALVAVVLALVAVRDDHSNGKRVRVLERELAVLCHRQVVVGGRATATGFKLATRQGC